MQLEQVLGVAARVRRPRSARAAVVRDRRRLGARHRVALRRRSAGARRGRVRDAPAAAAARRPAAARPLVRRRARIAPGDPTVVVLGYDVWQRAFGGDPSDHRPQDPARRDAGHRDRRDAARASTSSTPGGVGARSSSTSRQAQPRQPLPRASSRGSSPARRSTAFRDELAALTGAGSDARSDQAHRSHRDPCRHAPDDRGAVPATTSSARSRRRCGCCRARCCSCC